MVHAKPTMATSITVQKEIICEVRKQFGSINLTRKEGDKIEWALAKIYCIGEGGAETEILATIQEYEQRKPHHEKRWDQEDMLDIIRGHPIDYAK